MKSGFGWWVPLATVACALTAPTAGAIAGPHDALITKHAAAHGVPESLVRRIIHIESKGNPRVISKGNYGLMQIRLGTAKSMGYRGTADGLLDPDTNMTYAVKYLAGAYRVAGGNADRAVSNYARGYYYEAKRQGVTGAVAAANSFAPPQASLAYGAADSFVRPVRPRPMAERGERLAFAQATGREESRSDEQMGAWMAAPARRRTR